MPFRPPPFDDFSSMAPPMYEGRTPIYQAPLNFPTSSPLLAIMQQMMGGPMGSMMGQHGMLASQFMPFQNIADQQFAAQFYRGQQQAMQFAARQDAGTYEATILGGMRTLGWDNDRRSRQMARQMARDISSVSPIFAQLMPETMEALHGRRGSATILAQQMHMAGQHGIDPFSGAFRMSGTSAGTMAQEIFARNFGPGADLSAMKGIGAGSAGMMYNELSQRGLLPSSIGRMGRDAQVRELAGMDMDDATLSRMSERTGHSIDELRRSRVRIQSMAKTGKVDVRELESMPGLGDMLATFDSQRVGNKIKDMSGVVSAMRDIFGDMGRPNAPMRELLAGLEKLTQNGTTTMGSAQLERTVRQTHTLARQVGVSMETVFGMTGQAAAAADRLGLDRQFALSGTQGALAFGAAAGQVGGLGTPAFGQLDKEKLAAYDLQLRMNAAASPMANRLGAVSRMSAMGLIQQGTAGAAMAQAIASGQSTFAFGGAQYDVGMKQAELAQLMSSSGVSASAFQGAINAPHLNQEYALQHNVQDLVRKQQHRDAGLVFSRSFMGAVSSSLTENGMGGKAGLEIAEKAGAGISAAILGMSAEDRAPDKYNANVNKIVEAQLKAAGMTDAQIKKLGPTGLAAITMKGRGVADQTFMSNYWGRIGERGALQMTDQKTLQETEARQATAASEAALQQSLAGLGVDSPLRRVVDAVINSNRGESFTDMAMQMMGGVDFEGLNASDLRVQSFLSQGGAYRDAERDKSGNLTTAGKTQQADALRRMEAMQTGGPAAGSELAAMAKSLGVSNESQLEAAIRTKYGDSPQGKQLLGTVHALRLAQGSGGLNEMLKQQGVAVGQKVRRQSIQDAVDFGKDATSLMNGMPGTVTEEFKTGQKYQEAVAATRTAMMTATDRTIEVLGDREAMSHLGAGGMDLVTSSLAADAELQALAKKAGVTPEELLLGTGGSKADQQQARALYQQQQKSLGEINARQGKRSGAPLSKAEEAAAESLRTARAQQPGGQAAAIIEGLLGKGPRAGIDREALAGAITSGNRQDNLMAQFGAHKQLEALAIDAGLLKSDASVNDRASAIQKLLGGGGKLDASQRNQVAALGRRQGIFGSLGEGADTQDEIDKLIKGTAASSSSAELDAKRKADRPTKIVGTLRIEGLDKGMLEGTASLGDVDFNSVV